MKYTHFIILCSLFSATCAAKIHVISDIGGESAVRFYEGLQPDQTMVEHFPNAIPSTLTEADVIPVVSHSLSPGKVDKIELDLAGISPIFLVGADDFSAQWLQDNYQMLLEKNAMGLVVNVQSVEELNALRQLSPNIPLIPTPGDDLADRLNLKHYPALLTESGLSQ